MLALVVVTIANPRYATFYYSRRWAVGVLAVFIGLAVIANLPAVQRRWGGINRVRWDRLALPVGIGCCAIAAVVAYATSYVPTWDSGLIELIALNSPRFPYSYYHDYMSRYPNNAVLLGLVRGAVKISHETGVSFDVIFLIINVVCFAAALLGLYLVVRRLRGSAAGVAAMVLLTAIVGINPAMAIAYTDIPGLWIPIWAVWCFLRARDVGSSGAAAAFAFGGAAILGFGYDLKTTPIVGVPAAAIWFIGVYLVRRRDLRRVLACLAALAIGTGAAVTLTQTATDRVMPSMHLDPTIATTPWQYAAAGLSIEQNNGITHYGGFSRVVNSATFNKPTAEQAAYSKRYIADRLRERGVSGMVGFELNKASFTWGDGMLFAYGEGSDARQRPKTSFPGAGLITAWNSPLGSLWFQRLALTQAVWWFLLLLVARQWLVGRVTGAQILMLLTVLGIAAFVQIFQGRGRYLTGHIPILITIAMTYWPVVIRSVRDRRIGQHAKRPDPSQREPSPVTSANRVDLSGA